MIAEKKYTILVDYDNLEKNQELGEEESISAISYLLNLLENSSDFFDGINALGRVDVFLYGGWYCEGNWTRKAQKISSTLSNSYPFLYTLQSGIKINVFTQLSFGLMCLPGRAFKGTFRRYPAKYRVANKYRCCNKSKPCVDFIRHLEENNQCMYCYSDQSDLLFCDSQKMIDTMICCDILHLSQQHENMIVVVTSDDDLLPPLFQNCLNNANIYHVLTRDKADKYFDRFYSAMAPGNYKQIAWK